jgi:hypothetical protein
MAKNDTGYDWTFRRIGGLDQVVLKTSDDLCHLPELDPKLWVALSCPASGMEFDARTLTLIDKDKDGRIRIPEIIEAMEWLCARLKDPGAIIDPPDALPLSAIDDSTDPGKKLLATGKAILGNLGKADAETLSEDDVKQSSAHASEMMFNGDGILPPLPSLDPDMQQYIIEAMHVIGGVEDTGGQAGINKEISAGFVKTLQGWRDWRNNVDHASAPLGSGTSEAWQLIEELRGKIDDYFLRCELASFAPQTQAMLNAEDKIAVPASQGVLDTSALADLPLAHVEPDKPLNLETALNPAWREKVIRFADLVKPLLADPKAMTPKEWKLIDEKFTPYAKALQLKPAPAAVTISFPPSSLPDKLGDERVSEILASDLPARFDELADKDSNMPAAAADIAEVERLVLYHRHLYRLLNNFVSFTEFYAPDKEAAFQSGTLYIDGRSCRLCMPAAEIENHAKLASRSQLFLLYCHCTQGRKQGTKDPEKQMDIVAAVTSGDSDLLLEGRNGVFVDNIGADWDATVMKVVSNPIGLWQALWSPYKKVGNMITEQINKIASDKQAGLIASAGQKLDQMSTTAMNPAAAPAPSFDIGRNVGIFAAVGLALGAIGTAVAGIARALFAMEWWQLPLLILGLFLIISGPSLLIAWLKLRQRTLGPLLEASGWAVNGRVVINYGLSHQLTQTAELPENSHSDGFIDPLLHYKRWRMKAFYIAFIVGILAVAGWLWFKSTHGSKAQEAAPPAQAAPATPPASSSP